MLLEILICALRVIDLLFSEKLPLFQSSNMSIILHTPVQHTVEKLQIIQGLSNNFFFLENVKKTGEYFLKFLFLFESTFVPINNGK